MTNPPPRRSTRKRLTPERYGFEEDTVAAKRRRETNRLHLCDLPVDILRDHIFGFLCCSSDRFALQTTSKLFRNLSNSPETLEHMGLLYDEDSDDEDSDNEDSDNEEENTIIQPLDTPSKVITRLLPFARANNLDALLLLGKLATYVEDDLEVGMALFQKGMDEGDVRCQYELANLLVRCRHDEPKEQGQRLIQQAAEAGHAPSQLTVGVTNGSNRQAIEQTKTEMKSMRCLAFLLQAKPDPPKPTWKGYACSNPLCTRQCYKVRKRRVREWLKFKRPNEYWRDVRRTLLQQFSSTHYNPETTYFVTDFQCCARCMAADYCGRACQVVHWKTHKHECLPLPLAG